MQYDVDAKWDDPCEKQQERRQSYRFPAEFQFDIAARIPEQEGHMVGPGRLKDLSLTGARLVTKHRLRENQSVYVRFRTRECPDTLALPRKITGVARVVRVSNKGGRSREVALRFDDDLASSMPFAVFVNHHQQASHHPTPMTVT